MGVDSAGELRGSPFGGALWETMVYSELQRLLAAGAGAWQLAFWRDRTKEADFLLHKAGRVLLADAKWAEHPDGPGRLARVRAEFRAAPPAAIVCRTANAYPLGEGVTALPLSGLPAWISG
jgi:predicted AAA+ superfamily ATPase